VKFVRELINVRNMLAEYARWHKCVLSRWFRQFFAEEEFGRNSDRVSWPTAAWRPRSADRHQLTTLSTQYTRPSGILGHRTHRPPSKTRFQMNSEIQAADETCRQSLKTFLFVQC